LLSVNNRLSMIVTSSGLRSRALGPGIVPRPNVRANYGSLDPTMSTDPDLGPLPDRADFRLPMMDPAFPAKAFAQGE
jgi:hypothetical protein